MDTVRFFTIELVGKFFFAQIWGKVGQSELTIDLLIFFRKSFLENLIFNDFLLFAWSETTRITQKCKVPYIFIGFLRTFFAVQPNWVRN